MCSPSAPEPPDPQETAAAQTGTNVSTAIANTILSNPNESTPYGSVEYNYGNTNIPQIETYTIPGQPLPPGQGAGPGLPGGLGDIGGGGTPSGGGFGPSSTGYSVGGEQFDSYEAALEYQQGLPGYDPDSVYSWTDPSTGETYTIPRPSVTQTLTPEGQQIQDNTVQTQINLSELANDQSAFLGDHMGTPFEYNPGEHEGWALGLYDDLNSDNMAREDEALRTRLTMQGITPGSEAWNREMQGYSSGRQDSRNRFLLDSYGTGMQTALTNRNQPINEITALLSGSQVQQPNFIGANTSQIPTTDYAGLVNENYRAELANWQQQQAGRQSILGGMFGLGAGALSGGYF